MVKRIPVPETIWRPIAELIASAHGITVDQLLGRGRNWCFSRPRAFFWRGVRAAPVPGFPDRVFSLPAIAEIGGHHHTTVLFGIESEAVSRPFKRYTPPRPPPEEPLLRPDSGVGRGAKDLTGERFGKLLVISRGPNRGPKGKTAVHWNCVCDCGAARVVKANNLQGGNTQGCGRGCPARPIAKKRVSQAGYGYVDCSRPRRRRRVMESPAP